MTLPVSPNPIAYSNVNTETGQASNYSSSMSWIKSKAKTGFINNDLGAYRGLAFYAKNNAGNCNNANCTQGTLANCGNIQCVNCYNTTINCVNCDGATSYLQSNCNCACTYNCTSNTVSYNCDCACACDCTG